MAYSRGPTTALKSSASLLPGNLAVLIGVEAGRSLTYAVTHKNCANIVQIASGVCTQEQVAFDTSEDKDPASHLIQVLASGRRQPCNEWASLEQTVN